MNSSHPVLYSFRRCPYAIRARMALDHAGIELEHREVLLRDKPAAMIEASKKGTVPILQLPDGSVIDESYDVMRWALKQYDPDHWWREEFASQTLALVEENDHPFKASLDRYKYADRYPQQAQLDYRKQAERFLRKLENQLQGQAFLLSEQMTFSDVAIFPFIRQFAFVDKTWFDQAPYPKLQSWLQTFLDSSLFKSVMQKHRTWQEGSEPLMT